MAATICGRTFACVGLAFVLSGPSVADQNAATPAENLILVTIDGLRPEEFFDGADQRLMVEESGVKDVAACRAAYHRETREERREALLPFLWAQIKSGGWAAGDWHANSKVLITNGHYFSYPGYSELLCGYADARIDSNDKRYNPNTTVLEWLNQQSPFTGQV